ncbi:hypothetical protein NXF25_021437 [Crotalus adamanteus]|uniref:Uncharacterized protein n=1 Tax=Crotalus adamanteus TaxID=8729 RepID=A0AAW1B8R1_CROAD
MVGSLFNRNNQPLFSSHQRVILCLQKQLSILSGNEQSKDRRHQISIIALEIHNAENLTLSYTKTLSSTKS